MFGGANFLLTGAAKPISFTFSNFASKGTSTVEYGSVNSIAVNNSGFYVSQGSAYQGPGAGGTTLTSYSTNGLTWSTPTGLGYNFWNPMSSVVVDPTMSSTYNFAIAGNNNTSGYALAWISTDGISWASATAGINVAGVYPALGFGKPGGNSMWVAVGYNTSGLYYVQGTAPNLWYSNGSWQSITSSLTTAKTVAITYTSGLGFYAWIVPSTNYAYYTKSTDGITWSSVSNSTTISLTTTFSIVAAAVSGSGSSDSVMLISSNQCCLLNSAGSFSSINSLPGGTNVWQVVTYHKPFKCWLIFGRDSSYNAIYSYSINNGSTWSNPAFVGTSTAVIITGAAVSSTGQVEVVGYSNTTSYGVFSHSQ